jgi:hypothetical protein
MWRRWLRRMRGHGCHRPLWSSRLWARCRPQSRERQWQWRRHGLSTVWWPGLRELPGGSEVGPGIGPGRAARQAIVFGRRIARAQDVVVQRCRRAGATDSWVRALHRDDTVAARLLQLSADESQRSLSSKLMGVQTRLFDRVHAGRPASRGTLGSNGRACRDHL